VVEVLSPDLEAAIDFEISSAPEQIDAFRRQLLQQFRELGHLVPLWICSSWWFAFMARCETSCATVCQWLPCCFATRFSIGGMAATM